MKKYLIFIIFLIRITLKAEIVNTSVGFYNNPIGISEEFLFFSWQSDKENIGQKAYQIIISDDYKLISKNIGNNYNSGKIYSSQNIRIKINHKNFLPAKKYFWKIKIWDTNNKVYLSDISYFVLSLNNEHWKNAKWIAFEILDDSLKVFPGVHGSGKNLGNKALKRSIIPCFRKNFILEKELKEAYLFVASPGHYEAFINGQKVSNYFLTPSWSNYKKRIYFNTYEVTKFLQKNNCIGIIAGNGFYYINRERYRKLTIAEGYPVVIAKLVVRYKDDTCEEIVTDETWKTFPSPIIYSSIYGGEDYDARKEQKSWNLPEFVDDNWQNVVINCNLSTELLTPEIIYPNTYKDVYKPVNSWKLYENSYVFDFGQNMSGIIKINVRGNKDDVITIFPAELISSNKDINQKNSGSPFYYKYILKGDSFETWQPSFSYYGFRYARVDFSSTDNKIIFLDSLKSIHISNSAPEVGNFNCSNILFNDIYKLIKWAIRSNMQSVLTDCPHREKLGWLEQTYLMGSAIHYNYDIYHLYCKIIYDMMDAQDNSGLVPSIAPEYVVFEGGFRDSPEWGSASIILPYMIYKWYGDTGILRSSWTMMKKYFNYLQSKAVNHILDYGLGDWYDLGPQKPGFAQLTPNALTATATYYYNAFILKEVAKVLKDTLSLKKFKILTDEIKNEFNKIFFDSVKCIYATGSQTAMAMPLVLDIVPIKYKNKVVKNFVDSIKKNDYKLTAGDIGFYYVLKALTDNGYVDIVYKMNNRDDVPGYGYQIKKGATALTESWQALESVSNNHLMLGHLMDWFFYALGGIKQQDNSIAYKNILFEPSFIDDLEFANIYFYSPYGKIVSNWKKIDNKIIYFVTIPSNCTALVKLNKKYIKSILTINNKKPKKLSNSENFIFINLNSGKYVIEMKKNNYE